MRTPLPRFALMRVRANDMASRISRIVNEVETELRKRDYATTYFDSLRSR